MARLRRSVTSGPGLTRRRRGKGFSYADADGHTVTDPGTLARIRGLAIPPAWEDVWICPWPNGHIQALGTDAAGRRQYRYHDDWRVHRDREKFDRVVEFARTLPHLRRAVARDLAGEGLGGDRVLAAIVRLLDVGYFRIGGEEYAKEHETFGVASLHREHVTTHGDVMVFHYPAKGSIDRTLHVRDAQSLAVVTALRHRRSGGPHLFAYKKGTRWAPVHGDDVNAYIKSVAGEHFSAKDFRTWSATVLAAATLAGYDDVPASPSARHRAVVASVKATALQLGNTPAVCRASYIDPRVIDRFECGESVGHRLAELSGRAGLPIGTARRRLEEAVLDLIGHDTTRRRAR